MKTVAITSIERYSPHCKKFSRATKFSGFMMLTAFRANFQERVLVRGPSINDFINFFHWDPWPRIFWHLLVIILAKIGCKGSSISPLFLIPSPLKMMTSIMKTLLPRGLLFYNVIRSNSHELRQWKLVFFAKLTWNRKISFSNHQLSKSY